MWTYAIDKKKYKNEPLSDPSKSNKLRGYPQIFLVRARAYIKMT